MPTAPDKILDNIDYAARELLEAPVDDRAAMLEGIAKALTKRLLQDNPGIGIHELRGALLPSSMQFGLASHDPGGQVCSLSDRCSIHGVNNPCAQSSERN